MRRRAADAVRACRLAASGAIVALLLAGTAPARAADVLVAVAANFAATLKELEAPFEAATGHTMTATTGSTGKLFAQIVNGAPFAVLLAADTLTPERLEAEGHAIPDTRFTYAVGRLALWSSDASRIRGDGRAALTAPDLRHLAIANPDLAPYGVAAREVLQSLDLWEALRNRIVMGQNIGQVHSMVATGNAQLGFVALSALLSDEQQSGSRWEVPQELFTPIRQGAVLLKPGEHNEAAHALLAFLRTPSAAELMERHGYTPDAG